MGESHISEERFVSRVAQAGTCDEDALWRMRLNSSLVNLSSLAHGDEHWSFSQLGTHSLENFFSLLRRESFEDNRHAVARRIIAKTALVASVMILGWSDSGGHHNELLNNWIVPLFSYWWLQDSLPLSISESFSQ
jgi:hypothetical protein